MVILQLFKTMEECLDMKKILASFLIVLVGLSLTACGNNNKQAKENSSLKAQNSRLKSHSESKRQVKMSDEEYALAAYLKMDKQSIKDLSSHSENMHWVVNNNKYSIDFGAHTTVMTVNNDNVEVTYDDIEGDHMGHANGHKTYSKKELSKEYGKDKKAITDLLNSKKSTNNASAANTNNTNNNNSGNGQANNNQNGHTVTNSDGTKSIVENGQTFTPKYNENGQIDYWQVKDADGHVHMFGDTSPYWQQKEQQLNQ